MAKLRLEEVGENQWRFIWPRIADTATEVFFEALDYAEEGKMSKARQLLKKVLEIYPEHIDALHHLSMMSEDHGKNLNEKAVQIGLSAFPEKFNEKSLLEWGWIENRPFLRAYHTKGLIALEQEKTDEAIKLFNQIISWNPNDNQGAREILADVYVNNGKWNDMLALSNKYPNDYNPSMHFGSALALYKKGGKDKANQELKEAVKHSPLCANILLEKNPKKPKSEMPGYITVGGADQAYEFWREQGKVWSGEEIKNWLVSVINSC